MAKRALITGIAGQDGSYLSELLLSKGYEVFGIVRRNSVPENQDTRLKHLSGKVKTIYGDLLDFQSLQCAVRLAEPDEIFNLASQSHVRISFDVPLFTIQVNALGVANLLEVCRLDAPEARMYQASSSEMYGTGVDSDRMQREATPMHPVSPYGCAKLMAYSLVRNYRRAYKMYAANGILFNHESSRRGSNFVTAKVVKTAVEIKFGLKDEIRLGNIDSQRDWGHSKDYVRAMWHILQQDEPDDFVIATGKTRSVRQMCEFVFDELGLDFYKHLVIDEAYVRPDELPYLCGDCSKAKKAFGWEPEYTFESMMREIISFWIEHFEGTR